MKRIFGLFIVFLMVFSLFQSCRKDEIGPNDIKLKNVTALTFTDIHVENPDGSNDYGTLAPGETSDYIRFDKAYNKADISLKIGDDVYNTEAVNFTALVPLVKGKLTYDVSIKDTLNHILQISISEILPY